MWEGVGVDARAGKPNSTVIHNGTVRHIKQPHAGQKGGHLCLLLYGQSNGISKLQEQCFPSHVLKEHNFSFLLS